MPDFRVTVKLGLPPTGYVVVRAASAEDAVRITGELIDELELTNTDDRILMEHIEDLRVVDVRPVTSEEEEPINIARDPALSHQLPEAVEDGGS
jgi:hypothetical protein